MEHPFLVRHTLKQRFMNSRSARCLPIFICADTTSPLLDAPGRRVSVAFSVSQLPRCGEYVYESGARINERSRPCKCEQKQCRRLIVGAAPLKERVASSRFPRPSTFLRIPNLRDVGAFSHYERFYARRSINFFLGRRCVIEHFHSVGTKGYHIRTQSM